MLLPYLNKDLIEAGCDEAGRGCLAGAVYAAAVILPTDFKNELLNDSKQLLWRGRWASSLPKKLTKSIFSMPPFLPCTVLLTN